MLCIWVEIYLRTASGFGGATKNTSRSECMEKCRWGNGGQKYFQKTEGEGPVFLCGAS